MARSGLRRREVICAVVRSTLRGLRAINTQYHVSERVAWDVQGTTGMKSLHDIDARYPLALAEVRRVNRRATHIIGLNAGTSMRRYVCRICGQLIDTDSAKWPATKHALENASAHAEMHNAALAERDTWCPQCGWTDGHHGFRVLNKARKGDSNEK